MKKILYISNYKRGVGGISSQIDLLCNCIRKEQSPVNDKQYSTDVFSTKGNPIVRLYMFLKLLWGARRYDVLHIHGCSDWGMLPVVYGVIAGKLWNKHIIVTYHGGEAAEYFTKHGAFARRWLMKADKVIVLSGFLEKVFDEFDIPCIVIPNIVTLRGDLYLPKQIIAPKFISIRHLKSLYRIDLILRAYELVLAHYPKATLDILGQGEQREKLERYVQEHHLFGVRFVGQVPNEKIYDYMQSNDIMLSAPIIDNMPVSLLEAMNAGLLVISSNVGGVPYMVEHQKSGLLFEGGEPSNVIRGMTEQILWALEHQKESLKMIESAHKNVQRYSWAEVRKQLLPLYECI